MVRKDTANTITLALLCICSTLLTACHREEAGSHEAAGGTPVVYTVNYPLMYFAERIGGDLIDVTYPGPADEDPAFWEPSPDDISAYQSADAILLNGATYAKWLAMASLPASRMIDTSASFSSSFIHLEEATTHSHGPGGDHSHAGTAFTTWLDFRQGLAQAEAVQDALAKLRPQQAERFTANLAALSDDLMDLDAQMMTLAEQIGDQPLVASHPVYQYWARRYGLNLRAVMWEPEVVPDDAAMSQLKALLGDHPAKLMIWEGEAAAESVALLQAIGVQSVVFDPCGTVPEQGDFLSTMRQNIGDLERIAVIPSGE